MQGKYTQVHMRYCMVVVQMMSILGYERFVIVAGVVPVLDYSHPHLTKYTQILLYMYNDVSKAASTNVDHLFNFARESASFMS